MPRWVRGVYAVLGALVAAYVVSYAVRGADQSWPIVDNWCVAGFELTVGVICLLRIRTRRSGRAFPLALGAGLVSWGIGDLLLAAESLHGAKPSVPSPADVFYLGFYPLAYVALMLLVRDEVKRFDAATWLDGAVAGLGAAAVLAAFAFHAVVQTVGGSGLSVATNLAYPVGDTLLLALVVAGTATLPDRMKAPWLLLAAGCTVNAIGDTVNVLQSTVASTRLGTAINATAWPIAILLMSLSVWVTPRRSRGRPARAGARVSRSPASPAWPHSRSCVSPRGWRRPASPSAWRRRPSPSPASAW